MEFTEIFKTLLNSKEIIQNGSLVLIALIVFAENGLIFAFFLPGDYLLFSAGLFCGAGKIDTPIEVLTSIILISALTGSFFGYFFGKIVGKSLMRRKNSIFFKYEYIVKTRLYYMKFGGKTLVISKFLPIVRTFAPVIAGIVGMNIRKFTWYTLIGCLTWVVSMVIGGYSLGHIFPNLINYLEYIIFAFLGVTSIIVIKGIISAKKQKIPADLKNI